MKPIAPMLFALLLATMACAAPPVAVATPTASVVAPPPMPTALFSGQIGMGGYPMITTEQVGVIPSESRVRISSAQFDGVEWIYQIVAMDESSLADARESQLDYAPDVTPGPTPTDADVVNPTDSPTSVPTTAAPDATAAPTSDESSSGSPIIHSFSAGEHLLEPGDSIIFNWDTSGGVSAEIRHIRPDGTYGQWYDVPLSGSYTVTTDPEAHNTHTYQLYVHGDSSDATAEIAVTFHCHTSWYFTPGPPYCPDEASTHLDAVAQTFEHGRMIWLDIDSVNSNWSDNVIWVLFENGQAATFYDQWQPGDLESDPAIIPPEGFFQPVRGFGKVWRDNNYIREGLGWATAPEQPYDSGYQHLSGHKPRVQCEYVEVPEGRVIAFCGSMAWQWEYATP